MKTVSLHELKRNLSRWIDAAAGGERIVITRYRRPVAELGAAAGPELHVGAKFGEGLPRPGEGLPGPLLVRSTRGRYLEVLEEDRRGR